MIFHTPLGALSPGWGVGDIRFGMSRGDVKAMLGDPQVEVDHDEDGHACLSYAGGAHLYFDPDEHGRLTLILLEEASALRVPAAERAALDEKSIVSWLGTSDFKVEETEFQTEDGAPSFERARIFSDRGITLYSNEADRLTGCSVYVVMDEHGHFCWPNHRP